MNYELARKNMVENQIRANKVTDTKIIDAFSNVEREKFVPEQYREISYNDEDILLSRNRFMMKPMILARLFQSLSLKGNENILLDLAQSLSSHVQLINSEERKQLHLAAVFACNFSNYMYTIADELLAKNNLDLNLLKPLIIETANKIKENKPALMQTGPAKREDKAVIENHLQLLAKSKDYQDIYKLITENIIKNS